MVGVNHNYTNKKLWLILTTKSGEEIMQEPKDQRLILKVDAYDTMVDGLTKVTPVGNKLLVEFNDYVTGANAKVYTSGDVMLRTIESAVEREYVRERRKYSKIFRSGWQYFDKPIERASRFTAELKGGGKYEHIKTWHIDRSTVEVIYRDRYPEYYPIEKEDATTDTQQGE